MKNRVSCILRNIIVLILTIACFTTAEASEAVPEDLSYILGPGDIIIVNVYRAPDFNTEVQIGDDGTVALNLIGRVDVNGLTAQKTGDLVQDKLIQGGIFVNPIVNVQIKQYKSRVVSVLGAVEKPGEYILDVKNVRIGDILARSGAEIGNAGGSVQILRGGIPIKLFKLIDIISKHDEFELHPRDVIFVIKAPYFYISGEVNKPGGYEIEPGLTIGRAIALAGGLTPRGSHNKIRVTRLIEQKEGTFRSPQSNEVMPNDLINIGSRVF